MKEGPGKEAGGQSTWMPKAEGNMGFSAYGASVEARLLNGQIKGMTRSFIRRK